MDAAVACVPVEKIKEQNLEASCPGDSSAGHLGFDQHDHPWCHPRTPPPYGLTRYQFAFFLGKRFWYPIL